MHAKRRISLALLVSVAAPWAALLAVSGLSLLFAGPRLAALGETPRIVLGLAAWAAGQLVFMCLIADRLFPLASRRAVWWIEIFTSTLMIASLAWLMLILAGALAS